MSRIRIYIVLLACSLIFLFPHESFAQLMAEHVVIDQEMPRKSRKKKKEKDENKGFFFGGYLGGGYSNGWTVIVSPTVGYQFNSRIRSSIGVEYFYSNIDNRFFTQSVNSIGPFVNAQYLVSTNFFLQSEYQYQSYKRNDLSLNDDFLFLGGGYTSHFGRGVGYNMTFLYNVLYDSNDPNRLTNTPVEIRGGIVYGL